MVLYKSHGAHSSLVDRQRLHAAALLKVGSWKVQFPKEESWCFMRRESDLFFSPAKNGIGAFLQLI